MSPKSCEGRNLKEKDLRNDFDLKNFSVEINNIRLDTTKAVSGEAEKEFIHIGKQQ